MDPMECLTYPIPNPKAISLGRQDSTAWYSRVRQLLDSLEPRDRCNNLEQDPLQGRVVPLEPPVVPLEELRRCTPVARLVAPQVVPQVVLQS